MTVNIMQATMALESAPRTGIRKGILEKGVKNSSLIEAVLLIIAIII